MASFLDTFDRANVALHGNNGWVVVQDDGTYAGVEVYQSAATNVDGSVATRACQQTATTSPSTDRQSVEAWVSSTVEHASAAVIQVGTSGSLNNVSATWPGTRGVFVELSYLTGGERRLTLQSDWPGSLTTLATLTLVASGGVVTEAYRGGLLDNGALGVAQKLRLVVEPKDYGMLARVYVNQAEHEQPTLEHKILRDYVDETGDFGTGAKGAWWFGFGACGTNRALFVGEIDAEDFTVTDRVELVHRSEHQITFGELRRRVVRLVSNSANYNVDALLLTDSINDAVEDLIHVAGHKGWFLERAETLTLTTDTNGLVTLPAYVRTVDRLENADNGLPYDWQLDTLDSAGALVIRMGRTLSGKSVRTRYRVHHVRMSEDDDLCVIPRQHAELVAIAAAMRLAEMEPTATLAESATRRYAMLLAGYHADLSKYTAMRREAMGEEPYIRRHLPRCWT